MNPRLDRRVRELRARVRIRSWEYRQRRHAHGVWFRLRRLLADASGAFAIPSDEARALVAEGHGAEPAGNELQPPKIIVWARPERIARIASARRIPVRLGRDFLEADGVALTPFEPGPLAGPPA